MFRVITKFAVRVDPFRGPGWLRLCESRAADSFDIDDKISSTKKKGEHTEDGGGEGRGEEEEEEKKDGWIPACQQVDKGLKRVHVPAQIFASPHLARRTGRVPFWTLAFRKYGCRFENEIEKGIKNERASDGTTANDKERQTARRGACARAAIIFPLSLERKAGARPRPSRID